MNRGIVIHFNSLRKVSYLAFLTYNHRFLQYLVAVLYCTVVISNQDLQLRRLHPILSEAFVHYMKLK